jgi:hypothetical protein
MCERVESVVYRNPTTGPLRGVVVVRGTGTGTGKVSLVRTNEQIFPAGTNSSRVRS